MTPFSNNVSRLAFGLMVSVALPQLAGAAPLTLPNSVQPGQVERNLRVIERPPVSAEPLISVPDGQGTKPLKGDVTFVLKEVKFEGLNALTLEDVKPLYENMIGQKVNLGAVNKLAADITALYRNRGYILSRAVVPPQRVGDGIVTIRIIEGFVGNVTIEGDVGGQNTALQGFADKIKMQNPLNAKDLERYLLLIQDLPGVVARAVLKPSTTQPGASDVVITVQRRPVEVSASIDNRGSRYLGPFQATASVAGNNMFGLDDQTQIRAINSIFEPRELQYGEIRHEEQIGSEGTKAVVSASEIVTHPGSTLRVLDIDGYSRNFSAGVSHPFIRSRQTNMFGNASVEIKQVDVKALNTKLYQDKLRNLNVGGSYDTLDGWNGVNRVDANVTKGLGWDTDSDNGLRSRINGRPDFWKVAATASRLQPISGPWAVQLSAAGQYSLDPLLASEEFALGGAQFNTAYDPAEITGDSGIDGRLELQYNQASDSLYFSQYQFYGFYDIGKVWNRNIVFASERDDQSMASAGLGTRFNFTTALSGSAELAFPLTKQVAAYGDESYSPRFFFALQYRY